MIPGSLEELAEAVGTCDRDRTKVAIAGGDTLRAMGYPVDKPHATLSTTGLARIVDDAPTDLVVCAQAGITLRDLSIALSRHGTFVPFDAPLADRATLGGTLAAGWIGPRRHVYGRVRDHVLGTVAVLADGTIARAGGIVVKNVAGYDLSRLYGGSFGTLAVLAQVNLKTQPLPAASRLFVARLPEGTRIRAAAVLGLLAIVPAAAFWVLGFRNTIDGEDGTEGRLIALIEGSAHLLERATRDLRSALGRAGVPETHVIDAGAREAFQRVIDAYVTNLGERSMTYRVPADPSDAQPRVLALRELATTFELRSDTIVDVMNGDAILRVNDLDARALGTKIQMFDDALHDLEPSARIVAGDHPSRAILNVWGAPPAALDHMRALKAAFDPNGTLNPGRFIERL